MKKLFSSCAIALFVVALATSGAWAQSQIDIAAADGNVADVDVNATAAGAYVVGTEWRGRKVGIQHVTVVDLIGAVAVHRLRHQETKGRGYQPEPLDRAGAEIQTVGAAIVGIDVDGVQGDRTHVQIGLRKQAEHLCILVVLAVRAADLVPAIEPGDTGV